MTASSALTLATDDVVELLTDLEVPDDAAKYAVGRAARKGYHRGSAGKWHFQVNSHPHDEAGQRRFTVTVHARRTGPGSRPGIPSVQG
jgi:hypothetical protein